MKQQVWVTDTYIGCFECPPEPTLGWVYANEVLIPVERNGADLFTTFRDALLVHGYVEALPDDDCMWWGEHEPAWLLQSKLEAQFRKDPHREPMSVAIRWLETYSRGGFSLVHRGYKDQQWASLMRRMRMGEDLSLGDFAYMEATTGMSANFWLDVSRRKGVPHEGGVLPEGTVPVLDGANSTEVIIPLAEVRVLAGSRLDPESIDVTPRSFTPEGIDVTAHGVGKEVPHA